MNELVIRCAAVPPPTRANIALCRIAVCRMPYDAMARRMPSRKTVIIATGAALFLFRVCALAAVGASAAVTALRVHAIKREHV